MSRSSKTGSEEAGSARGPVQTPAQSPMQAPVQAHLPLFYQDPVLLRYEDHKDLALRRSDSMRFAARANAVPLVAGEFAAAARSFPIVFTGGEEAFPVAVMGLTRDHNLFVDAIGKWRADTYLPAWLRRYPFIATTTSDNQQLLCADLASDRIVKVGKEGSEPLFESHGTPTPSTRAVMDLCVAMNRDHENTVEFARAVEEAGILADRHARIRIGDNEEFAIDGFRLIDETAFRKLPSHTLGDWNRRGWLDLVVLHLSSQQNWQTLIDIKARYDARTAA